MPGIPKAFAHYLAAWNEPDPDRIRRHLDRSVAPTVVFADPANRTVGPDELEAMIRAAHRDLPNAEYRRVSAVDGGHDRRYRYRWEVWIDGARAVEGMDCTTVDEHGLITRLDGFFGDFPPREDDADS
jgi:hypothetical protein